MGKQSFIQNKVWMTTVLGVIAMITIVAFAFWNINRQDQRMRDNLINRVENISQAIDSDVLQQLSGTPADQSSPYYQRLKEQLIATSRIYPNSRVMYVLGQNDDCSVFFYVDSELPGASTESQSGDLYTKTAKLKNNCIKDGLPMTVGPAMDDSGRWITAFYPIRDHANGDVIAAFGMDVDAHDWRMETIHSASLPILIFTILVILIIGTIHVFQYRQDNPEIYRKHFFTRYALVLCIGLLGACLTALFTWYTIYAENISRQESFNRLAGFHAETITSSIARIDTTSLESIKQFYQGSDFVTREEFSKFTEHLLRDPFIFAWVWMPDTQHKPIQAIESAAQQDGFPDFQIWGWDSSGQKATGENDDAAYPVLYISPQSLESPILGYDVASVESQHDLLRTSIETGITTATDPFIFFQADDQAKIIFVIKPITLEDNPSGQVGAVAAIVLPGQILKSVHLESIQQEGDPQDIGLYTDLFQIYPDQEIQLLSSTSPESYQQIHLCANLQNHRYAEFTFLKPVFLFGKTFVIVSHPSPDFYRSHPASDGKTIAISGIILTIVVMLLVGNYADRNYILQDMVQQRTAELEESERKFQIALKNSPVVVYQQDRELRYTWIHNPNPGFEAQNIIGKTDHDLLPSDEADQLMQIKRHVIHSGEGIRKVVRTTISGKTFHHNMTVEPIRSETGECLGITCSSVDITDLVEAYDATIEGWSMALELRDQETEGHTLRVAKLAEKLAETLGVGEEELIHIRRGALLHDIGKIGIPDDILLKPGKLTAGEWEIMKQHPVFAYNMLAKIEYLQPALDIPYCHHERWDGTGYPRGLKGKQIPLAARIFAVIDVWDALLSDRPYRDAWHEDKVREYIRAHAGSHFDPAVVDAFFDIIFSFAKDQPV